MLTRSIANVLHRLQITDGERVIRVTTGHPAMQQITATGCTLTAVMAAFLASEPPDSMLAAAHAMCIYGYAGSTFLHHHRVQAGAIAALNSATGQRDMCKRSNLQVVR